MLNLKSRKKFSKQFKTGNLNTIDYKQVKNFVKKKIKWTIILVLILIVGISLKYTYHFKNINYFINNIELYLEEEKSDKYTENKSHQKVIKVNVNEANFSHLLNIKHMSRNDAIKILMYRELNGKIESFDDIKQIIDIKKKNIQRIKRQICY